MKITIDNLDGRGPCDYTASLDAGQAPRVRRRLNHPAELHLSLVANSPDFVVPVAGARVMMGQANGGDVFTGYVATVPKFEYLGWGERGPLYRYRVLALSDEIVLDRKTIPPRSPFVGRAAGEIVRQLANDLLPGFFDTQAVADLDALPRYQADPQKTWSEHAAEIALQARGCYRAQQGALHFANIGTITHTLDETSATFSPEGLKLQPVDRLVNDVTVVGRMEPRTYVKDYFVGDGLTLHFNLSQMPFTRRSQTLMEEEYKGTVLSATRWSISDPAGVVSVSGGKLQVAGGTGMDGQTTVRFVEQIELGGALILQHGDVSFSAASDGVLGGLYAGNVSTSGCLAGFRITKTGGQSNLQAVIGGVVTGPSLTTQAGHRYVFTTRLYASEVYRREQTFHSSAHPAGNGLGGATVKADVRAVLEVHDIDPANPGSLIAPTMVLYDGVVAEAPDYCTYALVNAAELRCSITFTRLLRAADALVRSALPGGGTRTRLAGSLVEGAECRVSEEPALQFFPQHVPAANEELTVRYRGLGRAMAHMTDPESIAAQRHTGEDGIRSAVQRVAVPAPRTSVDCGNAARALLDDSVHAAWTGEYETWSDFLPGGAQDIFPGDSLEVHAPSRGAAFRAIVREVEIEAADAGEDHTRYKIRFADEAAEPLALAFETGRGVNPLELTPLTPTSDWNGVADLCFAEVTQITSTSVSTDAGLTPETSGGIEVRRSDVGWGPDNDRNLVGRFTTRSFSLPRLARVQDYFLRLYDAAWRYSKNSAALHVDYPF